MRSANARALEVEGAHACDMTTEVTDENDLIAVLENQVPGCQIHLPEDDAGFREPIPSDTGPLEALVGPRNHVSLDEGVAHRGDARMTYGGSWRAA